MRKDYQMISKERVTKALMACFFLVSCMVYSASVDLRFIPTCYDAGQEATTSKACFVRGLHNTVRVDVYAVTQDVNVGISDLTLTMSYPTGVAKGDVTAKIAFVDDPAWVEEHPEWIPENLGREDTEPGEASKVYAAKAVFGLYSKANTHGVSVGTVPVKLGAVTFTINPADNAVVIPLKLNNAGWWNYAMNIYAGNDVRFVDSAGQVINQVEVPVYDRRVALAGNLFIQKGTETSKEYTLSSTGGDGGAATYALVGDNGGATKGTVTIAGNKATYTVDADKVDTEFFGENADSFQFTASDASTGASEPAKVTVSYRANPPPLITALEGLPELGSTVTIAEVDEAGDPNIVTLGIHAIDDPEVDPCSIQSIVWFINDADDPDGEPLVQYEEALSDPRPDSANSPLAYPLDYGIIEGSPRPQSKDFIVTVAVADAQGATATASWTVKVNDVDRPQEAPGDVTGFTPAASKTDDDITVNYTEAPADLDGDPISYRITWTCGAKEYIGNPLPKAMTLKGEVWTVSVVSVTAPYGAGSEVLSAAVNGMVAIGNTAPVANNGRLFIRKGAETEKKIILSATDADPADLEHMSYELVGVNGGAARGTVVIVGNVATYTVTDPNVEFYGDAADTFTFVANDGTDDSNAAAVTVTYRENPPADIVALAGQPALGTVVDVPEVDATGAPSVFTLGINATDSNIVRPFGVKKIAWAVNGDGWTISAPSTDYANVPSQDNTVSITLPGYETIAGAGRPASQDFTVTVTVWDAMDVESTATWTIRVGDVDRPASAPTT
ncbi:MAG: hypothetical protein GX617_02330, partial [Lentisphaerae bacterium]|nr:hypothetical protein [Lentisphaerota bacterium]